MVAIVEALGCDVAINSFHILAYLVTLNHSCRVFDILTKQVREKENVVDTCKQVDSALQINHTL